MTKRSTWWRPSDGGDLIAEIGNLRLVVLADRDHHGLVPFLIMRRPSLDLPYVLFRSGTAENARAAMVSAWRIAIGTRAETDFEPPAIPQDRSVTEDAGLKSAEEGATDK